jgi:predicted MFS family arabinose efflux permease
MSTQVLRVGAREFGLLISIMAIGSVGGAVLSAGPSRPDLRHLLLAASVLATGFAIAAMAPGYWYFAAALIPVGIAAVAFTTLTSSVMQLEAEPFMRGRVIALRTTIAMGGAPLGAPVLGWIADSLGARWALAVAAGAAALAALIAVQGVRRLH